MAVTRLSGGLTPANGSDPRTFPAIWNATADDIEQAETDIAAAELDITDLQNEKANVINTDGDNGITIYVGSIDPDVAYTPVTGDVWIETPSGS
jgi:hypothetical protein